MFMINIMRIASASGSLTTCLKFTEIKITMMFKHVSEVSNLFALEIIIIFRIFYL